ncbi:unnamed protein product, partial [Polarella glacialis]
MTTRLLSRSDVLRGGKSRGPSAPQDKVGQQRGGLSRRAGSRAGSRSRWHTRSCQAEGSCPSAALAPAAVQQPQEEEIIVSPASAPVAVEVAVEVAEEVDEEVQDLSDDLDLDLHDLLRGIVKDAVDDWAFEEDFIDHGEMLAVQSLDLEPDIHEEAAAVVGHCLPSSRSMLPSSRPRLCRAQPRLCPRSMSFAAQVPE